MSNKLINETSPYLLQHAENPVNWFPWCEEAFKKAKDENKPIFLSIGYSTCHWCHVMAHESFEDNRTANILNDYFVSIKVDREERPDIDSVYMSVCQALTGNGGWPMSIFMTWDKKPFFAGTYFPVSPRYGMPSFAELLLEIANRWNNDKKELLQSADKITEHLKNTHTEKSGTKDTDIVEKAVQTLLKIADKENGGFGSAPKFPTPHNLLFLMLYSELHNNKDTLNVAEKTLLQMRRGGIFDHIGYGFSRYSTDKYFLVPHFEKMLYDNALLIIAYSTAYNITKKRIYLDTAEKTAFYILREMTHDDGGFFSAQDADSEGVEGKFYTFSLNEITDILGKEKGTAFAETFDITENGNFEGVNIPNLLKNSNTNPGFADEINKLYDFRKKRTELHLDDKILLSWNAMMIAALSILYRVSKNEEYLKAAQKTQKFIEKNLCKDLQLFTSYRDGKCSSYGFLDDYAFYVTSLIELYNSTLDKNYLEKAKKFCNETVKRFADNENGGFYLCKKDNTELFMNPKDTYDGAIPSGNSVMMYNFVRLYQLTGKDKYNDFCKKQTEFMSSQAISYPLGYSMFLTSVLMYKNPPTHIIIVPKDLSELSRIKENLPFFANVSVVPESHEYPIINDKTTYYICKNYACLPPTNTPEFL